MFDWYTTMNQPDWDGRTYAFPQPTGVAPVQGSVSGGLLGKLAEEGEAQATPRIPSPLGPKQEQGGEDASPAPVQRPAPQANPLMAPAFVSLAGPVMQPQMMPQQPGAWQYQMPVAWPRPRLLRSGRRGRMPARTWLRGSRSTR